MSTGLLRIVGRCFIMAKELPYFKFEPSQWENGNIQLCSLEAHGVFINVCSMYWQRLGNLPYKLALQKICGGNAAALDSLIDEDVIKIIDGHICIDFLNEQLAEFESTSKVNSENARNGWLKRKNNATVVRPHSDPNAIRGEEIRGDKRKEDKRKEYIDSPTEIFDLGSNPDGLHIFIKDSTKITIKIFQQSFEKYLTGTFGHAYDGQKITIRSPPPIRKFFELKNGDIFNDNKHVWSSFKKLWLEIPAKNNGLQQ